MSDINLVNNLKSLAADGNNKLDNWQFGTFASLPTAASLAGRKPFEFAVVDGSGNIVGRHYWNGSAIVTYGTAGAGVQSVNAVANTGIYVNNTDPTNPGVGLSAATQSTQGAMSATDKAKLDDATAAATADKLALRDAEGKLSVVAGTAADHAVTKAQLDAVTAGLGSTAIGTWSASGNAYPATGASGSGNPKKGDRYVITAAGTLGGKAVEVDDLLLALTDNPGQTAANWHVAQANLDQATEAARGSVRLASQGDVNTGTDTQKAVTPATLKGRLDNGVAAPRFTTTIVGDGTDKTFAIAHGLGREPSSVKVRQAVSPFAYVFVASRYVDASTIELQGSLPAGNYAVSVDA